MTQRPQALLAVTAGRLLLVAVGLMMIGLAAFRPQTTPLQLIPLGAALLAIAVLADRLTGVELGSFKLALASPVPVLADRDATFKSFFEAENPRLRRFAVLMTADERTGSDLAKEALASTRVHWGEIRPNEQLFYAFRELLKDVEGVGFLRALAGRRRGKHGTAGRSGDADGADWLRAARVLQSLAPTVRAAILLAHLESMPESQIAAILGRPARAVRADLQEGLAQLGPKVGDMVGTLT